MHTILVVDDEAAIRTALDQILTYESYRVLTAPSGRAALEVLDGEKVDAQIGRASCRERVYSNV